MPDPKLAALLLAATLTTAAQASPDAAALQAELDAADPGAPQAELAADFLATDRHGRWHEAADYLASLRAAPPTHRLQVQAVRRFGPVVLRHSLQQSQGGERLRRTEVFLRQHGNWQLLSTQDSPLREGVELGLLRGQAPPLPVWSGRDPQSEPLSLLRTLNAQYVQAFRESDVGWYDAHLASEFTVISSDGSYKDRAAALADFARPTFALHLHDFPVDQVRVRLLGDLALIHARNAYTFKDGRRAESRYTDIWLREAGRWRCIAAHITAVTP